MPKKNLPTLVEIENYWPMATRAELVIEMLENAFCLTTSQICGILRCSRKYVDDYIKPNVEHIFLNRVFLMNVAKTYFNNDAESIENFMMLYKEYYYFSVADFMRYFNDTIKCTRQTICINAYDRLKKGKRNRKLFEEFKQRYNDASPHMKTKLFDDIYDYTDLFSSSSFVLPVNSYDKRIEYKHCEIEMKFTLDNLHSLMTVAELREKYKSNEAVYRQMFLIGAIKVAFNGKVFFYDENQEKHPDYFFGVPCSYEDYF